MSRAGGGRPTTAGISRVLTIDALTDAGMFTGKPGDRATLDLVWRLDGRREAMTGEIEIGESAIKMHIRFTATLLDGSRHPMAQQIRLVALPQHFGGVRWLFCCPQRGFHVRALYRPGWSRFWGSRYYHGLAYASTRLSYRDRAFQQSAKLRTALDPDCECYVDPMPDRPKGMWTRTYDRHLARIDAAEAIIDARLFALVERLQRQAERQR